jgi:post-segregation antitoxin (ccd killing protein)
MGYVTTIYLKDELAKQAKENNISINEAVRIGIAILLKEKGIEQYDNPLNRKRNIEAMKTEIETLKKVLNEKTL